MNIHAGEWAAVLGTSVLELWAAIPLGFAFGLHPVLTVVLCAVGSSISAVVVIYLAKPLRDWLVARAQRKGKTKEGRIARIWQRYGIIGIGVLSPLLTGAPLGAAIGISFGAQAGRLLLWMIIGIAFWTIVLTAAVHYGLAGFMHLT